MNDAAGSEEHEFRLGLGHPVLELLATLARRRVAPVERLATPADLSRWLELSGVANAVRVDSEQVEDARRLREALYRLVTAARGEQSPAPADVELVNEWASRPAPSPQLDSSLRVTLAGDDPCRATLGRLAREGIELIAGDQLHKIRECADPTCSLMFIDHSRPGRRRWCSMERCGNRAKTARYRQRRRSVA